MLAFGLVFFFLSPLSTTAKEFFAAQGKEGKEPGMFMLITSLVISWIFAKSITNAADLGMSYGIVGGVGYGVYYLSFVVAGFVIYRMRSKGGFTSIHQFLNSKFGRVGVVLFSLLIAFRLFNEVWSNSMVIGSYFGEVGSAQFYWSIVIFTALTLAYVLKGGLRSSLLTDAIQMLLFGLLLILIFSFIWPKTVGGLDTYLSSGEWRWGAGLNFMLAAFLQIFSYPFHDPVLTDRAFITKPKVMLKGFVLASVIGFACILLFSFVGVFAAQEGLVGSSTVQVSKMLGLGGMLSMNFIMVTSAASTLDSAFASFSKLMVIDLKVVRSHSISAGRLVMIAMAILGTLPVFMNPAILSATTISGTMVIGLAPVFLLWNFKAGPLSFLLSVLTGVVFGALLATGAVPDWWLLTKGAHADFLWCNVWGLLACFAMYFSPFFFKFLSR